MTIPKQEQGRYWGAPGNAPLLVAFLLLVTKHDTTPIS